MKLDSVGINLTNFCNQSCPFCFASKEMASPLKREITFSDFQFLATKMKRNGITHLHFQGGEPTIHSEFSKILNYTLRHFFFITLYTNGIFPEKSKEALLSAGSRIFLVINITTPGFLLNKKIRDIVIKNISLFIKKTIVVLAITDTFQKYKNLIKIFQFISKKGLIKQVGIRLGFTLSEAGKKNFININDFPKVGKNFCKIVNYLDKKGPPKFIATSAGMTPCMFTEAQRKFIKKRGIRIRSDCHLGYHDGWFTINPDLTAFKCYPLSTLDRVHITKNSNFRNLKEHFELRQMKYRKEMILPKCKKCPFYGIGNGKCSGPCIAFRINALKQYNSIKLS